MNSSPRELLLAAFERVNPGDISIRHHWTKDRIRLHSFKHKGYWFHGRNRERKTMELFARLVSRGDCVLDLGGHIGYTALYFSYLVGVAGSVYVFEPSLENLKYLRGNVAAGPRANIIVVEKAVSDEIGTVRFYYESITGQNSTMLPELQIGNVSGRYHQCVVQTTTIDRFVHENELRPRFIKIDIEGAELYALAGMAKTIQLFKPRIMVEVNLRGDTVWRFMSDAGYQLYGESRDQITSADGLKSLSLQTSKKFGKPPNVFAFHTTDEVAHSELLAT